MTPEPEDDPLRPGAWDAILVYGIGLLALLALLGLAAAVYR